MSSEPQDLLRHALGLGRNDRECRNHFVTEPGRADDPHCEARVAERLMMMSREGHPLSGGDPIYSMTNAGQVLNFCEACAMDLATCDCVNARPAWVRREPPEV